MLAPVHLNYHRIRDTNKGLLDIQVQTSKLKKKY